MMTFPLHALRWSVFVLVVGCAAACGGNYVAEDDDGADFGDDSGSGGSGGTDGSGGDGSGGTPAGTGGEPPGCCLAAPGCNPNDTEIASEGDCPVGASCYSNTICCSTIWCMVEEPLCDAIPVCMSDEEEVSECEPNAVCTPRALCGSVILCQQKDVSCERDEEPDRHYVAESPDSCAAIDYSCPEHTTSFSNECGCGCEQPSDCPDVLNCQPGGMVDPLCGSAECPYTERHL